MNFNDFSKKLKTLSVCVLSLLVFASAWLLPGVDLAAQANDYEQNSQYKYESKPQEDYYPQTQSTIQNKVESFQDKVQDTTKQVQKEVAKNIAEAQKAVDQAGEQIQATVESAQDKLGETPNLETATGSIQAAIQSAINSVKAFFNR